MKKEIKKMLGELVGKDIANNILSSMFPLPIQGYKKGKILTLKQIKELPQNSIIHVYCEDEDAHKRTNDFHILLKSEDFFGTTDGFSFPMEKNFTDETLLENCDNCGWTFTISEAIKIN